MIAQMKAGDRKFLNKDLKSICKTILGTAKSMHIEITK